MKCLIAKIRTAKNLYVDVALRADSSSVEWTTVGELPVVIELEPGRSGPVDLHYVLLN